MNRVETKKLLKRRDSLLEIYCKLENDSNDENNEITINDIYKDSRNTIGRTLYNIDKQLLKYVKESPVGEWLLQIRGVTPDIAAGLLAYFNIKNKDCAAQFIKYAGADSNNSVYHNNVKDIMDKLKCNFEVQPESLYNKLRIDKLVELLQQENMQIITATIRADRYMRKIFISHLFEEMYREEHDGQLPERYNNDNCIIIEPEVPYTK